MLVRVTCSCKKSWFVDDSLAGTIVNCKSCKAGTVVPGDPPAGTLAAAPVASAPPQAPAPPPVPAPAAENPPAPALFQANGPGLPPPPNPWAIPAQPAAAPQTPPAAAVPTSSVEEEFFLAYQYPPPLWGDKKMYRVYRDEDALTFLHLGLFFDGVDFSNAARGGVPAEAALLAGAAGLLIMGAEKLGAMSEAPKLRARLAAVEAMGPRERLLEATKKPNILAPAKDLSEVKLVPWEGYKGPWATDEKGRPMVSLRFKLEGRGKFDINLRDGADIALAIRWLREMLTPERVMITFPIDGPPPVRR